MRRIEKNVNGHKFVLETFSSFDEILRVSENREIKSECRYVTREMKRDKKYMGTGSYEEAVELLKYGYTENIDAIKNHIKNLEKQGTVQKVSFKNDIVGYAPIVPNAIIGVPQSMINNVRVPKKAKVITIVVDMAVSSRTTKSQVFDYGCKVVEKVIQLEQSGFRVRLEYMKCFNNGNNHTACSTVIKNENQPLDLKRIMFPLTHVAMQRYISWDWYDRVPDAYWDSGRGHSLSVLDKSERDFIVKELVADEKNKYIVCYGDNLQDVFKKVR